MSSTNDGGDIKNTIRELESGGAAIDADNDQLLQTVKNSILYRATICGDREAFMRVVEFVDKEYAEAAEALTDTVDAWDRLLRVTAMRFGVKVIADSMLADVVENNT